MTIMWKRFVLAAMSITLTCGLFQGTNAAAPHSNGSCQIERVIVQAQGPESLILGDNSGTTNVSEGVVQTDAPLMIFSASKLVTGVILMRLVEQGILAIDDKVSDFLPWWTTNETDPRSQVEVYHLITQTAIFGTHACTSDNTSSPSECSQAIYNESYGVLTEILGDLVTTMPDLDPATITPGNYFLYSESYFVLVGHILSQVTNMTWNELFWQEIAIPAGMDDVGTPSGPAYVLPSFSHPAPGYGLYISGLQYSKFLHAYFSGLLVNQTSMDFIEAPHTLLQNATHIKQEITSVPSSNWGQWGHYGIGCWVLCDTDNCSTSGCQIMHSFGAAGFLPWVDRDTNYWGIIVQEEVGDLFTTGSLDSMGWSTSLPLMGNLMPPIESFIVSGQEWTDNCSDDDAATSNVDGVGASASENGATESTGTSESDAVGTGENNEAEGSEFEGGTEDVVDLETSASAGPQFMQVNTFGVILTCLCSSFLYILLH